MKTISPHYTCRLVGAGGGGGGSDARVPASGRARLTPLFPFPRLLALASPSSFFAAAATSAAFAVAAVTAARGILMRRRCLGMSKLDAPAPAGAAGAASAAGASPGAAVFAAARVLSEAAVAVPAGSTLTPRSSSLGSLPPWGMLFGLTLRDWAALS